MANLCIILILCFFLPIGIFPVIYGLIKCKDNDYEKMDDTTAVISNENQENSSSGIVNNQDLFE